MDKRNKLLLTCILGGLTDEALDEFEGSTDHRINEVESTVALLSDSVGELDGVLADLIDFRQAVARAQEIRN